MPPKTKRKSRKAQLVLEKYQCYFLTIVLTPAYYWYGMSVMLPKLLKLSYINSFTYWIHVFLGTYGFINVAGNMLLSILTDPRLKAYSGPGMYCDICKQNRPERTWHCTTCNACILERDHHCCFLSHCVGRKNLRYFIFMLFHLVLSLSYTMLYSSFVISSEFDIDSFIQTSCIVLYPFHVFSNPNPPDLNRILLILFLYIEIFLLPFSIIFLFIHMRNVLNGLTAYEYFKGKTPNNAHWKSNMIHVFGTRWYLALLWPFVKSLLPNKHIEV